MRESLAAVWLREGHLRFILNQSRHHAPNETGGVLIGYTTSKGIVITDVIGAGPNAKHNRSSYAPDLDFDYREISAIYDESGRMHTYIGDWHTHPSGPFRLSRKDKIALKTIAACKEARIRCPLMGLAAGEGADWKIGFWQYEFRPILARTIPLQMQLY